MQLEVADLIDENASSVILWEPNEAIESYRQSLVQDLRNRSSTLRTKLIGLKNTSILKAAEEIESGKFLSRDIVNKIANKYLGKKYKSLIRHSNFMYYLWGATNLYCDPVLRQEEFYYGKAKLNYLMEIANGFTKKEKKDRVLSNEVDALKETFEMVGVIRSILDRIPMSQIIKLREETEAKRFRKKWRQLVIEAKKIGEMNGVDDMSKEREALLELIRSEVKREHVKKKTYSQSKSILSIGSFVTSGIATILGGPILGGASMISGMLGIDPLISEMEKRIGGKEITLFVAKLQNFLDIS